MKIHSSSHTPNPTSPTSPVSTETTVKADASEITSKTGHEEKRQVIVNGQGVSVQFATDLATGRTIIQVVDSESGELLRQIPPEDVLNVLRRLGSKGSLFSRSF